MDQITFIFEHCISGKEESGGIIKKHSQIRNLFMLDQEFVSCKKGETIDFNSILFLKVTTPFKNLWGYDRNLVPLAFQQSGHLFYENTAVGGVEIGVSISKEQNIHKETRNTGEFKMLFHAFLHSL